jgi:hypothetical protein
VCGCVRVLNFHSNFMYKGFDSRYDLVLGLSKRTNLYCTKIECSFCYLGGYANCAHATDDPRTRELCEDDIVF